MTDVIQHDDPNAVGTGIYAGMTLLHIAAFSGNAEQVRELLGRGADMEAKSVYNPNTMKEAGKLINDAWAKRKLREQGIIAELRLSNNASPLIMASPHRDSAAAKLLIARGANVNAVDKKGSTALHFAAEAGNAETCRALVAGGARVTVARSFNESDGATPLHLAARSGSAEVCEILLSAGADWRAIDMNRSPLHHAAEKGHLDACRVLIAHGAHPDYRREVKTGRYSFYTPLQDAMSSDRVAVVRYFLLESDADFRQAAPDGKTLEDLARSKGRLDLVDLMSQLSHSTATQDSVREAIDAAAHGDGEPRVKCNRGMSPL